jgi:hypothetical protein
MANRKWQTMIYKTLQKIKDRAMLTQLKTKNTVIASSWWSFSPPNLISLMYQKIIKWDYIFHASMLSFNKQ